MESVTRFLVVSLWSQIHSWIRGSTWRSLISSFLKTEICAVVALVAIKYALHDPFNVLESWDVNSVDPCSWRMVTCTPDRFVSSLWVNFLLALFSAGFRGQKVWSTASITYGWTRTDLLVMFLFFAENRGLPSQSLSGTLSPGIGNLTYLQSVYAIISPVYLQLVSSS